jgi:hypothetical protein
MALFFAESNQRNKQLPPVPPASTTQCPTASPPQIILINKFSTQLFLNSQPQHNMRNKEEKKVENR